MHKTVPITPWQYLLIVAICIGTAIYTWFTVDSQGLHVQYREEIQYEAESFSKKAQELFSGDSAMALVPRIEIWCINRNISLLVPKPSNSMFSKASYDAKFLEENHTKSVEGIAYIINTDTTCESTMHMATIKPKAQFELEYKYVNLNRNNTVDLYYFIKNGVLLDVLTAFGTPKTTSASPTVVSAVHKNSTVSDTATKDPAVSKEQATNSKAVEPSDPVAENISSN